MRRLSLAIVLVALPLAACASSASASVTIGQTGTTTSTCDANADRVQPSVTDGSSYVVPETGTITSWSTFGNSGGAMLAMKVYRLNPDGTYLVVGHDGPHLIPTGLNTFATSIPVKVGDVLGDSTPPGSNGECRFQATGDNFYLYSAGNLSDGSSGTFSRTNTVADSRLNVSAVVDPANTFSVGATTNNKNGTATIALTLPNPGDLTAGGDGVSASSARESKAVGAGPAQILIAATGKKRKKLKRKGRVTVSVAITYTPQNGAPAVQTVSVQLRKKHKKK